MRFIASTSSARQNPPRLPPDSNFKYLRPPTQSRTLPSPDSFTGLSQVTSHLHNIAEKLYNFVHPSFPLQQKAVPLEKLPFLSLSFLSYYTLLSLSYSVSLRTLANNARFSLSCSVAQRYRFLRDRNPVRGASELCASNADTQSSVGTGSRLQGLGDFIRSTKGKDTIRGNR